jgi:2-iminobutanoate/2-iminopropanoate deaminase
MREAQVSSSAAAKTAINPDNVWKPEDYFNIYLQPGMEKTPPEHAGWAQGARKGPFVFISGQTPTLPDGTTISKDMHGQLRQALVNFRNVVAAEGGSLEDVVQIRYYFNAGYMEEGLAALRDIGAEFWSYPYPSTTCVEVVRVAWADHLLEIEGMAILDD